MEVRKDPITRSWVIVGDEPEKHAPEGRCPFCPGATNAPQVISSLPPGEHGAGPVMAAGHPSPLYPGEGQPQRRTGGNYHLIKTVGAPQGVVQSLPHDLWLWGASPFAISHVLLLA